MLIDWFTVVAQTLNFLILVWVMKRYLYQPVLQAIDAREKRIAAQIADAETREQAAAQQQEEYRRKNAAFDQERASLLNKAADEAKAERQRLIEAARQAADALSSRREELLRSDARSLNESLARRAQEEVFAIARKTLADLAGTSLEERMAAVFVSRLRSLDEGARSRLAGALQTAAEPALVRSACELPQEQRALLQQAVAEVFSAASGLRFETAPGIIGGIELSAGGQKVVWSIADYLAALEQDVAGLLARPDSSANAPGTKPA
jgi:F-type H+-transporting ATPase subunit b